MVSITATPAFALDLPDSRLTPGLAGPLGKAQLCARSFRTRTIRDVPEETKDKVYAEYAMVRGRSPCPCEVDHLIPLELGGSDAIPNLWPQSYTTKPYNAHVKDTLENQLHILVCRGQLDLEAARHEIATDWVAAYKRYGGHAYRRR